MKELSIFLKDIGYDSGVWVSVRHLARILHANKIDYELVTYKNDEDLLDKIMNTESRCYNLQVPSFSDDIMNKIMSRKKNVVLSIHSTMCNLQTEENVLRRLLLWGQQYKGKLRITNPAACETEGFNYLDGVEYLYLPNTFSYNVDQKEVERMIEEKCGHLRNLIRISLFCAYQPLKNMITQVAAVIKLAKTYPVELHVFRANELNPIFQNIQLMAEQNRLRLVIHDKMTNEECFEVTKQMHLGLQVSLSETFSYVAFEHEILGIPVVGSTSVPYSSEIAAYNDVRTMVNCMENIIADKEVYKEYSVKARTTAEDIRIKNAEQALNTIKRMIAGTE